MSASSPERPDHTLGPDYFARIYADEVDPWGFATRPYEDAKYTDTLASLPQERYHRGLEIGCSIGVLSGRLAPRVDALVSTEINVKALTEARRRNAAHTHLEFVELMFPRERPSGSFDLVVLSEVAYYWAQAEFDAARDALIEQLEPGGHLILVHYAPEETDYPLTGQQVHAAYSAYGQQPGARLHHITGGLRTAGYYLDVYERR